MKSQIMSKVPNDNNKIRKIKRSVLFWCKRDQEIKHEYMKRKKRSFNQMADPI